MSNPDDRIFDYMEEKGCPDFIMKEEGSPFCLHDSDGWCSLSKYFNCILRENQELNPKSKHKSKPQNQDGKSKANPSPNTLDADRSEGLRTSEAAPSSIILSYSSIQDFAQCPRKYYWSRLIEPLEPSLAQLKGLCGHEILEYIHTALQPELEGINAIVDKYQDILSPSSQTPNPSLEVLKALGWAYLEMEQFGNMKGRTEVYWEAEGLHGYIDLVQYGDEQGSLIIWDFKFTSNPYYVTKHGLSLQLGLYLIGNPSIQRITVRVIKFPDLQRRKAETLEEYIKRTHQQIKKSPNAYITDLHFWREEIDLEEIRDEVRKIRQSLASFTSPKDYYKNRLACSAPYPCSYLPLCELGLKDWHDSPITEALYKERSKERGVQSNVHDLREQRDWEDDFCLPI